MTISPGITERITRKTEKMGRYLEPNADLKVHMTREPNNLRKVEITVNVTGSLLRAESKSDDNLFIAIDQALAKMERQIHKHRDKLRIRHEAFTPEDFEFIDEMDTSDERKLVKNKTFTVRPMSIEDAIMRMEMLGHSFFVFVNIETERTNVLYLRKDGNLGLLEPEA